MEAGPTAAWSRPAPAEAPMVCPAMYTSVRGRLDARMAKLPSVISGLMCPPDAGSAAKMNSVRLTPARAPPTSGSRNGEVMLCLS